jgi:RNA polymerase sigma-70 factor (ECF subfamily)
MPLSELTGRGFPTTAWSVVLAAGHDPTGAQGALARLCEAYWYPVYAYIRHRGYSSQDAEDLTQQFFAHLLETHLVQAARPDRGRFRSFFLASVRNFLANEWDRAHAGKRGGAAVALPLDFVAAEGRYAAELSNRLTPERLFDRRCALALLERVLMRLRSEFETAGRTPRFELMKSFLDSEPSESSYARLAAGLDISEGAARVAVYRLRSRYRELLREEISEIVASPDEIEDEIRHLLAALDEG